MITALYLLWAVSQHWITFKGLSILCLSKEAVVNMWRIHKKIIGIDKFWIFLAFSCSVFCLKFYIDSTVQNVVVRNINVVLDKSPTLSAPVTEELWRLAVIFGIFLVVKKRSLTFPIVMSTLVFALLHNPHLILEGDGAQYLVATGVCGFFLARASLRYGLMYAVVFHCFQNLLTAEIRGSVLVFTVAAMLSVMFSYLGTRGINNRLKTFQADNPNQI